MKKLIIITFAFIVLISSFKYMSLGAQGNEGNKKHYRITPTPTIDTDDDCIFDGGLDDKICITPTLTPEPTATPEASITPDIQPIPVGSDSRTPSTTSTVQIGDCGDIQPSNVPNFTVINDQNGLKLEWAIIPGAETIDIRYGLKDGEWIYGAIGIPNTGNYVVEGLHPNTPYFFQIAGVHGCAIGNWSQTVDPTYEKNI